MVNQKCSVPFRYQKKKTQMRFQTVVEKILPPRVDEVDLPRNSDSACLARLSTAKLGEVPYSVSYLLISQLITCILSPVVRL